MTGPAGMGRCDWPDLDPMPAPEARREDEGDYQPDNYHMKLYGDKEFPKER